MTLLQYFVDKIPPPSLATYLFPYPALIQLKQTPELIFFGLAKNISCRHATVSQNYFSVPFCSEDVSCWQGEEKIELSRKRCANSLVLAEWSNRRIAERMGISCSTVVYWKNRFEENGEISRKVGSGSRRKTTYYNRPITTAQEISGGFLFSFFF